MTVWAVIGGEVDFGAPAAAPLPAGEQPVDRRQGQVAFGQVPPRRPDRTRQAAPLNRTRRDLVIGLPCWAAARTHRRRLAHCRSVRSPKRGRCTARAVPHRSGADPHHRPELGLAYPRLRVAVDLQAADRDRPPGGRREPAAPVDEAWHTQVTMQGSLRQEGRATRPRWRSGCPTRTCAGSRSTAASTARPRRTRSTRSIWGGQGVASHEAAQRVYALLQTAIGPVAEDSAALAEATLAAVA